MSADDKRAGTSGLIYRAQKKASKKTLQGNRSSAYSSMTLAAYTARVPRRTATELLDPWTTPMVLCTDFRSSLGVRERQQSLKEALDHIVNILEVRLTLEDGDCDGERYLQDTSVSKAMAIIDEFETDGTDEEPPTKRSKVRRNHVTAAHLLNVVRSEVLQLFQALNLKNFGDKKHNEMFAPKAFGDKEHDNVTRYAFWLKHMSRMPLLYVAAYEILAGPGSSVSCKRLNSAALRVITLLRNRLKDGNKENLLLVLRVSPKWDGVPEENNIFNEDDAEICFHSDEEL